MEDQFDIDDIKLPTIMLIVGNGFDLDLNLKTSYREFVDSPYFKPLITGHIKSLIIEDKFLKNMQIYPNQLAQFIQEDKEKNGWVDLERCIRNYCNSQPEKRNEYKIEKELYAIRYFMYDYIMQNGIYHTDKDSLCKQRLAYRLLETIVRSQCNYNIWSFNYTDSVIDILTSLKVSEEDIANRVHFIHGSLFTTNKNGSLDLVLGTKYEQDVMKVCPAAIKSQKNPTYFRARERFDEQLSKAEIVIIMGHSLGETDEQYFASMLESKQLKVILLVTKTEESANDLLIRLDEISNGKFGKLIENHNIYCQTYASCDYIETITCKLEPSKEIEFNDMMSNALTGLYGNKYIDGVEDPR